MSNKENLPDWYKASLKRSSKKNWDAKPEWEKQNMNDN